MKIELWVVGKTKESYLREGISIYEQRLKHYNPIEIVYLPEVKNA
ncbi:MAG TPA: 23S rRNA (pseudouridine(1915)-N(3))-methyltransferase RlmH, partial [Phaeodactylibacter sp.]|nr:23S rRNA (pseudouridine(1915)-N(3))-methyltransferase RlmH [Phaeodactylibacter sp.]